jgi:hypothetical protein
MANNIVDIPFLNPIRFVPVSSENRNFDSQLFYSMIRDYETKIEYCQKWHYGDTIYLQVISNFAPVQIEFMTCSGKVLNTYNGTTKTSPFIDPSFAIYEFAINIPVIEEGRYYYRLNIGYDVTLEQFLSEPQYIQSEDPNTIMFNYRQSYNEFDVVFDTGITFGFRVDGSIGPLNPKSKDAVWNNQTYNLETISSIPYRVFKLAIGGMYGAPDWVVDKVNRILSCNTVSIDNRRYTKEDGAQWEAVTAEYYPMKGWKIDIRQTENRYSLRGQNNNSPAEQFAVVYNIETKIFGTFNDNASNNVIQVTKAE